MGRRRIGQLPGALAAVGLQVRVLAAAEDRDDSVLPRCMTDLEKAPHPELGRQELGVGGCGHRLDGAAPELTKERAGHFRRQLVPQELGDPRPDVEKAHIHRGYPFPAECGEEAIEGLQFIGHPGNDRIVAHSCCDPGRAESPEVFQPDLGRGGSRLEGPVVVRVQREKTDAGPHEIGRAGEEGDELVGDEPFGQERDGDSPPEQEVSRLVGHRQERGERLERIGRGAEAHGAGEAAHTGELGLEARGKIFIDHELAPWRGFRIRPSVAIDTGVGAAPRDVQGQHSLHAWDGERVKDLASPFGRERKVIEGWVSPRAVHRGTHS